MVFGRLWVSVLVFFSAIVFANNEDPWSRDLRLPIRSEILNCAVMLAPSEAQFKVGHDETYVRDGFEGLKTTINKMKASKRSTKGDWLYYEVPDFDEPDAEVNVRNQLVAAGFDPNSFRVKKMKAPPVKAEDSVGIKISTNSLEDFKTSIDQIIRERGLKSLHGAKFFVTSIKMGEEDATNRRFTEVLEAKGIKDAEIKVLSITHQLYNRMQLDQKITAFETDLKARIARLGKDVVAKEQFYITGVAPDEKQYVERRYKKILEAEGLSATQVHITEVSQQIVDEKTDEITIDILNKLAADHPEIRERITPTFLKRVKERLQYWLPSFKRDYQSPSKGEITSGVIATAAIEIPNAFVMANTLNPLDATVAISTHTAILLAFTIYKKFMVNWLLRPGKHPVQVLFDQMLLSVPFIINYNLAGNLTEILEFYKNFPDKASAWQATLNAFPKEIAEFSTTQGLTVLQQTLFYNVVITYGVRKWENSREGADDYDDARILSNYLQMPILALDAVALFWASGGASTIMEIGPVGINWGHVALAGLTLGGAVIAVKPQILTPFLKPYRWARAKVRWMKKQVRKLFQQPLEIILVPPQTAPRLSN